MTAFKFLIVSLIIGLAVISQFQLQRLSRFVTLTSNEINMAWVPVIPPGNNFGNEATARMHDAALCSIAKDEEAYVDEWVDYHHALGFDSIHIYDNSATFDLKQWGEEKGRHVTVIHYPGQNKQAAAYLDCARKLHKAGKHTWAAFFDLDEFLILKKHAHLEDFLHEQRLSGAIGVNWLMFGTNSRTVYSPVPVTKRFMYRLPDDNAVHAHIKSIVNLSAFDLSRTPHVHHPNLIHGTHQKDTNGKIFKGPFNPNGPTDVAVLYHYHWKSKKEYISKKQRGRADQRKANPQEVEDAIAAMYQNNGTIFDDAAWIAVKKYVPKYALFDVDLS
jgi:hypothetical protein